MQIPLIYKRRPQWGDTDAARIVYTGKIVDYILEAIDHFMREVVQLPWFELNVDHQMGTPFVSVHYDIYAPLTPRGELECRVYVTKLGNSSVSFRVEIDNHEGVRCVDAATVNVFVNNQTMTKISIPEPYRGRIAAYIAACGASNG